MFMLQNNLVWGNEGGLSIHADSGGSATALKGWIHNNLFANNRNNPALYVEGRQSSPYQEVTVYRNYFTKNVSPYKNVIILKQVILTFCTRTLNRDCLGRIECLDNVILLILIFYSGVSREYKW